MLNIYTQAQWRGEPLVELSGLSLGKVGGNLNEKLVSSTSKNPAMKQPIYSSEKGPYLTEDFERPGTTGHSHGPSPTASSTRNMKNTSTFSLCKVSGPQKSSFSCSEMWPNPYPHPGCHLVNLCVRCQFRQRRPRPVCSISEWKAREQLQG